MEVLRMHTASMTRCPSGIDAKALLGLVQRESSAAPPCRAACRRLLRGLLLHPLSSRGRVQTYPDPLTPTKFYPDQGNGLRGYVAVRSFRVELR